MHINTVIITSFILQSDTESHDAHCTNKIQLYDWPVNSSTILVEKLEVLILYQVVIVKAFKNGSLQYRVSHSEIVIYRQQK